MYVEEFDEYIKRNDPERHARFVNKYGNPGFNVQWRRVERSPGVWEYVGRAHRTDRFSSENWEFEMQNIKNINQFMQDEIKRAESTQ